VLLVAPYVDTRWLFTWLRLPLFPMVAFYVAYCVAAHLAVVDWLDYPFGWLWLRLRLFCVWLRLVTVAGYVCALLRLLRLLVGWLRLVGCYTCVCGCVDGLRLLVGLVARLFWLRYVYVRLRLLFVYVYTRLVVTRCTRLRWLILRWLVTGWLHLVVGCCYVDLVGYILRCCYTLLVCWLLLLVDFGYVTVGCCCYTRWFTLRWLICYFGYVVALVGWFYGYVDSRLRYGFAVGCCTRCGYVWLVPAFALTLVYRTFVTRCGWLLVVRLVTVVVTLRLHVYLHVLLVTVWFVGYGCYVGWFIWLVGWLFGCG